jgi:uncharacterized protein involved in exopolysaccharide biosynthesis
MTANVPDLLDETRDQLLGAKAFMRRVLHAWPTALAVLFVGGGACAAFLTLRRPTFRSETVLLYSEGSRLGEENDRLEPARSVTARLKEILMSRTSLDGVVGDLDLYPEIRRARGTVDASEELKKHVEFKAPGGDTFSIAFTGTSARQAQAVTARLADVVIGHDSELRKKQATAVRDFLEAEKKSTEDELKDAELALASFLGAHPRFALDATPLATGAAVRASLGASAQSQPSPGARGGLSSALAHLSSMVVEGSAHSDGAESRAGGDAMAEQMRARAALAAARANLTDLAARFTPMHPDVRAAQAEVERATARVAAADAAAAAKAPTPAPQAPPVRGAAVPKASAPEAPRSERDVVALETQWVMLTRRATEARQHQDQVEAALFKANMAASSEKGDGVQMAVIDPAYLPESAVPPGRAAIAGIFAAASLLLAAMCAALRGLMDDRVYDERDLRQLGPVLALVPRAGS